MTGNECLTETTVDELLNVSEKPFGIWFCFGYYSNTQEITH